MKKLLLFGGTSEEHELVRALAACHVATTLCVASEYGRALALQGNRTLSVRVGRMDAGQIAAMIQEEGFSFVIDATHPYAAEATQNIKAAAVKTEIPYFRLLREGSNMDGCITVSSVQQAAGTLAGLSGAALITTGSKELAAFTGIPGYQERLYPRVLPAVESIAVCLRLGFPSNHIIAMHGPFSRELNIALMRQFEIKTLVTKDGGKPGGFPEKREAAKALGADLIVIRRPDEKGYTQNEIIQILLG